MLPMCAGNTKGSHAASSPITVFIALASSLQDVETRGARAPVHNLTLPGGLTGRWPVGLDKDLMGLSLVAFSA